MDIVVYDDILNGLKEYNRNLAQNYGNNIVGIAPIKPTYPLTVFDEIRNQANAAYNTPYDKVSSLGYRVDIFAKTKGNITKQSIARKLAKDIDNFLTNHVGLLQVSWNINELENDSSIYKITLTYSANLHENRRTII